MFDTPTSSASFLHKLEIGSNTPSSVPTCFVTEIRLGVMANYVLITAAAALLATMLLSLPSFSTCGEGGGLAGSTVTTIEEAKYNTIASPMANYCATDFSKVSYAEVTAACPTSSPGASTACCAAFNTKACQHEAQVNDFGSLCPMMFINYLGVAGPYPAGYFVGPCIDGTKGFCIH